MGIVSEAPIVLIGPGSEWFWSMAQFVVVAVTLVGIYYQFRLQRSANAFDHLSRLQAEWSSETYARARLRAGHAILDAKPLPLAAIGPIGNFWEGVGALVRQRHVNARVVYDAIGNTARYWWGLMEEEVRRQRKLSETSDLMNNFEWLAARFAEFAKEEGTVADFSYAASVADMEAQVAGWEDRVQMLEESRAIRLIEPAPISRRKDRAASRAG